MNSQQQANQDLSKKLEDEAKNLNNPTSKNITKCLETAYQLLSYRIAQFAENPKMNYSELINSAENIIYLLTDLQPGLQPLEKIQSLLKSYAIQLKIKADPFINVNTSNSNDSKDQKEIKEIKSTDDKTTQENISLLRSYLGPEYSNYLSDIGGRIGKAVYSLFGWKWDTSIQPALNTTLSTTVVVPAIDKTKQKEIINLLVPMLKKLDNEIRPFLTELLQDEIKPVSVHRK